jgi:hypothetical protein
MFAKSDRPVLRIGYVVCMTHVGVVQMYCRLQLSYRLGLEVEVSMRGHMTAWWGSLRLRHHHHGTFLRHVSEVR